MSSSQQWRDFVAGVRENDETKTRAFRNHSLKALEGLQAVVASQQAAVWCLRDLMDADAVSLQVSRLPRDDKTLYVCPFMNKSELRARSMRCVQVLPANADALKRGGYLVHKDTIGLLESVRAVASAADYVRTHPEDDEHPRDETLCTDMRNALKLIELVVETRGKS